MEGKTVSAFLLNSIFLVLLSANHVISQESRPQGQITKFLLDLQTDVTGLVSRIRLPSPLQSLTSTVHRSIFQPVYGFLGNIVETVEDSSRTSRSGSSQIGKLDKVQFFLYSNRTVFTNDSYTKLYPEDDQSIKNGTFTSARPIKILIHGFQATGFYEFPQKLKNEYLQNTDFNVIVVDWSVLSYPPLGSARAFITYPSALNNVAFIARRVADLISAFHRTSVISSPDDIHLIGFSLGAHVCGQAAALIEKRLGSKVGRITALEPANVGLENAGPDVLVDKNDAKLVDAIHSSYLSFYEPVGHVDFYPNGGRNQPQCYDGLNAYENLIQAFLDLRYQCSHEYGYEVFSKTIQNRSVLACRCASWADYRNSCRNECPETVLFGDPTPSTARGLYFLETVLPVEVLRPAGPLKLFS